ncbi:[citrate (pro-3S)-lyase] ligase [Seleniivibrio sp.]|uniref:[citrate (pro-3S)-lyase] ligase n=1 Tax=Seleniivibrio sp. TaxID=2898801 RepID=UPI0025CC07E2|nr:[citrate (pro-3S)-lyase] ligase [Seleniivibrio sp.]MCD8553439.1 [citrate (pro-3S)-lyase] ligase [Seleniivibrio sp.]
MIGYLLTDSRIREARELLIDSGLEFDPNFDIFLGYFEAGKLIAVGARHKNVLKMVAVVSEHRDTGIFAEMISALVKDAFQAGYEHTFVFTKPEYSQSFQYLNFRPLAKTDDVAVLEYGYCIQDYLNKWKSIVRTGENSGIVMNCNPFTFGHRYLIETAAARSENVYVFVVEEDSSLIPFRVRLELVKKGTQDLGNVHILSTGPYAVSRITFPSYFLKDSEKVTQQQLKLDLSIFCGQIAPAFGIKKRFAGQEPVCRLTAIYNEAMKQTLPGYGIEFVEIERKTAGGRIISASSVREMLLGGETEKLREMVPEATYKYLTENTGVLASKNATPVLNS